MNFGINAIKALMDASGVSLEDGKAVVGKESLCENLISANLELDIYEEFPFAMLGKTLNRSVHGAYKKEKVEGKLSVIQYSSTESFK